MVAIYHGGICQIAISGDTALLLSHAVSLGPSLALLECPDWLAIAFGSFSEPSGASPGPAIRYAAAHEDATKCVRQVIDPFGDIMRNHVSALELAPVVKGVPPWLEQIADRKYPTSDVVGFIPRLVPQSAQDNALWMSRFLSSVARIKKDAGIAILLRPFSRDRTDHSAVAGMRRYFEGCFTKEAQVHSKDASRSETWRTHGAERRQNALQFLNECARTGAWWVGIRCFGANHAITGRVASLFWSCLMSVGGTSSFKEGGRSQTHFYNVPQSDAPDAWSLATLLNGNRPTLKDCRGRTIHELRESLMVHGLDPVLNPLPLDAGASEPSPEMTRMFLEKEVARVGGILKEYCADMVVPHKREILVSGERLGSLFQLPVTPTPAMEVVRGFGYCLVSRDQESTRSVKIGVYGALRPTDDKKQGDHASDETVDSVRLDVKSLTAHTLVVGTTGSGKTNTVVTVLLAVHTGQPDVRFAILEGAKREYQSYRKRLGIEGHYDLMSRSGFLELNIFEHPSHVAPEAHLSQISSLFEATLEMPAPLPALMREALTRAYVSYHEANAIKHQHPIRFWLMRSVLEVAAECGYSGEIAANIDAALRTRIRALSMGAGGRVLRGSTAWGDLSTQLVGQSILLELESIADQRSRSFVMSLFVLYYRYALEGARHDERRHGDGVRGPLRNVLVLEEAHRIIGKPSGREADTSSLEYFGNLLGEVRAFSCGVFISDQSPSRLIEDAMRNTSTKFLMRLVSGEDIHTAVHGAGLPDEACTEIPLLKTGQAILVRPEKQPALIQLAEVEKNAVDRSFETSDPSRVAEQRAELARDERDCVALLRALKAAVEWRPGAKRTIESFQRALAASCADEETWTALLTDAAGCEECNCVPRPMTFERLCEAHGRAILYRVTAAALRRTNAPASPQTTSRAKGHTDETNRSENLQAIYKARLPTFPADLVSRAKTNKPT